MFYGPLTQATGPRVALQALGFFYSEVSVRGWSAVNQALVQWQHNGTESPIAGPLAFQSAQWASVSAACLNACVAEFPESVQDFLACGQKDLSTLPVHWQQQAQHYFRCFVQHAYNKSLKAEVLKSEVLEDWVAFAWVWWVACSVYRELRPDLSVYLGQRLAEHISQTHGSFAVAEAVPVVYWALLRLPGFRQGGMNALWRGALQDEFQKPDVTLNTAHHQRQSQPTRVDHPRINPTACAKALQKAFRELAPVEASVTEHQAHPGMTLVAYQRSFWRQWWALVWYNGTLEDAFYAEFMNTDFDRSPESLAVRIKQRTRASLLKISAKSRQLLLAVPVLALMWLGVYTLGMNQSSPPEWWWQWQAPRHDENKHDENKDEDKATVFADINALCSSQLPWPQCLERLGLYAHGVDAQQHATLLAHMEHFQAWQALVQTTQSESREAIDFRNPAHIMQQYLDLITTDSPSNTTDKKPPAWRAALTAAYQQATDPQQRERLRWFWLQGFIAQQERRSINEWQGQDVPLHVLDFIDTNLQSDETRLNFVLTALAYQATLLKETDLDPLSLTLADLQYQYRPVYQLGDLFQGFKPVTPRNPWILGCQAEDASCPLDQQGSPTVQLSPYSILQQAVTQAQYTNYLEATHTLSPYQREELDERDQRSLLKSDQAMTLLSWQDVQGLLLWLTYQTGQALNLPSEAQWEYAAHLKDNNNHNSDHNTFLYQDNLQEWVADCWHPNYESLPDNGQARQEGCFDASQKMVRGAMAAHSHQDAMRNRSFYHENERDVDLGFRLVLNQPLESTAENKPPFPMTKMIEIPAGEFEMGCQPQDDECEDAEKPLHKVKLKGFLLGATEVTFEQYDYYCEQVAECEKPEDEGWGRGQRPVINVSWQDAQNYIVWLNQQDLPGGRFRLPSEAKWEYAARAGSETKYYWRQNPSGDYANGDEADGWPKDGYEKQTAPVASYKANAWGLFDMSGNVWEWCEDHWHEDYTDAPEDGSAWLEATAEAGCMIECCAAVRGTSFPGSLRSGLPRQHIGHHSRDAAVIGFRLAQDFSL